MYPKPRFFGNDRFLHIGNDLVFLFGMQYSLVDFVADACRFVIDRAAGVHPIIQYIRYAVTRPIIRNSRDLAAGIPTNGDKVLRRCRNPVRLQYSSDL